MSNVPIKFTGGLDANNKQIIGVGTPNANDKFHAVNVEYLDNLGIVGDSETMFVNVIDVISGDIASPVTKEYKNGIYLEKASTASSDISIKIRFGKQFLSRALPDVLFYESPVDLEGDFDGVVWDSLFTQPEREDFDFSINNQTLTNGDIEILGLDYTQTFEFTLKNVSNDVFYYFKNGTDISAVELVGFVKPNISSATITSGYGSGLSELSNGKTYVVEVTSDSNITEIQIKGDYLVSESINKGGVSLVESITTQTQNGVENPLTGAPEQGYFEIRVKDTNNTWSDWYDSSTATTPTNGIDFMLINNIAPVFDTITISYSNAPYTALNLFSEDGSTANIVVGGVDFIGSGVVIADEVGSSGLSISKTNNLLFVASSTTPTYKYNTPTVKLIATRGENGRTSEINVNVNIASVDMVINNLSNNVFRSGTNTGNTTQFNITTNQRINDKTIVLGSTIAGLTLSSDGIISGQNVNNLSINILDSSTKGTYNNLLEVELEGLSGRIVTRNFEIISRGFVERTMLGNNILNPIEIPHVVNANKLLVSIGKGNDTVECSYFAGGLTPGFQGDIDDQINEFSVFENTNIWYVVFDNNVHMLGAGDWLTNATIIIEEEI